MKTKLEMAHDWYMKHSESPSFMNTEVEMAWNYADLMQAEADKREKEEAEKKRKEMRELLNADNTFIEKEGQHFDDVEWQPDWSQAPDGYDWFCVGSETNNGYFCNIEPKTFKDKYWFVGEDSIEIINHGYQGDWRNSLRKRPE